MVSGDRWRLGSWLRACGTLAHQSWAKEGEEGKPKIKGFCKHSRSSSSLRPWVWGVLAPTCFTGPQREARPLDPALVTFPGDLSQQGALGPPGVTHG